MWRSKASVRIGALITLLIWVGVSALYGLLKPSVSGCILTYMFPTYIPIPTPPNVTASRYGLYLFHEGWKKIDFKERLKNLSGAPVLFIPGNGGSYKQVRSLGAVSNRVFQGLPLDRPKKTENNDIGITNIGLPNQYGGMLDWFAVDLEGEHSAMDGRILEDHTEYVVYAIHRILDQYKESHDVSLQEGAASSGNLARSVILVGHSMGGFVARASLIHPHLRKSAVETIMTLATPHQSPPLALQPSLAHYFAQINQEWRNGYEVQTSRGRYISNAPLSRVVVISISGGYNDYQVRSKLESLDGIVPPTHGFMITSTAMRNVWLSMEHQAIVWCNQLAAQVSRTLLSLIDKETGQPFPDVLHRVAIFMKMFHSGVPQHFDLTKSEVGKNSIEMDSQDGKSDTETQLYGLSACPSSAFGNHEIERDLYIQTTTVTIVALDGRRRWFDIDKLGSDGKDNFAFVTNLAPCSEVRIHLWPEKGTSMSESVNKRALEFTSRMVPIPRGTSSRQVEPGNQTEQSPPSAVFWLNSSDMRGFKFLTISVAPQPTLSGRPLPATSIGVGQFFNPQEGKRSISLISLVLSMFSQKELILGKDHPFLFNISFPFSLGLLPVYFAIKTTGCGIKKSGVYDAEPEDPETGRICELRCFPPVALAWDIVSGLHIYPNLDSKVIVVDSSPYLWESTKEADKTTVLLLIDPHCSYQKSLGISVTTAAGRFVLVYFSQIIGLSIAVVFFSLMQQAYAWEIGLPIPSMLSALELNLKLPFAFLLAVFPVLFALSISFLSSQSLPPFISIVVSVICYLLANATMILLIVASHLVFYLVAIIHMFIKKRFKTWEGNSKIHSALLSFKVARIMTTNPLLASALVASILVCLVHPALGLFVLLLVHSVCCLSAITSFLMTSFFSYLRTESNGGLSLYGGKYLNRVSSGTPDSPQSGSCYIETQLEIFHHRHGLFILHLLATFSFVPSLKAWLQRIGIRHSIPWLLDSVLCLGILLHGFCDPKPQLNFFMFRVLGMQGWEFRLSVVYLIAGYFSFLGGLALAPYRAFYAMATIGVISFGCRIVQRRNRVTGESHYSSRKHSHRH